MNADIYIMLISQLSDRYGSELVRMMDMYDKQNLRDITYSEAKEYYERLIASLMGCRYTCNCGISELLYDE